MVERLTPLRSLVRLEHPGGARKHVELVGFTRNGATRAQIRWGLAGYYYIDLKDGRICGMPASLSAQWHVPEDVLEQLRASADAERPSKGSKRGGAP